MVDGPETSVSEIVHLLGYGVPLSPDLIGKSPAVARLSQVIADAQTHEKQILSQPIASLFDDQNISTAGV